MGHDPSPRLRQGAQTHPVEPQAVVDFQTADGRVLKIFDESVDRWGGLSHRTVHTAKQPRLHVATVPRSSSGKGDTSSRGRQSPSPIIVNSKSPQASERQGRWNLPKLAPRIIFLAHRLAWWSLRHPLNQPTPCLTILQAEAARASRVVTSLRIAPPPLVLGRIADG